MGIRSSAVATVCLRAATPQKRIWPSITCSCACGWRSGSSEGFIRALSVVFSVATIPVVYALGHRLFGRKTGLLAAWLLAANAYHVRYAQEARGYALVVFLAALSTWLLVRNLQDPRRARWGIYALVSALAVYAHFYAALILLAQAGSLMFLPPENLPWQELWRAAR